MEKDFLTLAEQRYSARDFSNKQVEKEKLNKILQAGRLAPTAKNLQPQVIYSITSEQGLQKVNKTSPCIYGASTVLMICADMDICWKKGGNDSSEIDTSIVTTHMMLQAKELGVDSCWVLMFDREMASELFDLPKNIKPLFLLDLGYATDEKGKPADRHFDRKLLNETVIEL